MEEVNTIILNAVISLLVLGIIVSNLKRIELLKISSNLLRPLLLKTLYRGTIPKTRWLHYENLTRFPNGYLVSGDAIGHLNPIYGQGMTSAAMQAEVLDKLLVKEPLSATFWKTYFKHIAKVVSVPWQMTIREDFRFPKIAGLCQHLLVSTRRSHLSPPGDQGFVIKAQP